MDQQNVTISVPKPLLRKAKILAASRDQSLGELFRETLDQKVKEIEGYNKAKNRQLSFLRTGLDLGTKGSINIDRADLYER
jgi:hypothetical protein